MKTRFLALAAMVLGLASCQQEFNGVTPLEGEVDFQLGVSAPELITRAGDAENAPQNAWNSAYGAIDYLQALEATVSDEYRTDWREVDLRYTLEVYDKADNYAGATPVKDRQVIIVDEYQPVTFDLRLIPNREYHFVVFADFVAQDASNDPAIDVQDDLGLHHTIGATLQDITINADAINDECTDAYFDTMDLTISNSAANGMELKRPYGKVRVIATDLAELNLNVNPTKVEVRYYAKHPQTFNAVTGAIGAEVEEAYTLLSVYNKGVGKESLANHFYTAGYDDETTTNANNATRHTHMTLFTDYILAGEDQSPISFDMTVYEGDEGNYEVIKFTEFSTQIPVQRNHLTTIIGNVLTTATEINVTIDDNFFGEYEQIIYEEAYKIDEETDTFYAYTADGLLKWSWLSNVAKENLHLEVMADISMPLFTVVEDAANETYKYTTTPVTITNGKPDGSNWVIVGDYENNNWYNDRVIRGNGKTISNLTIYSEEDTVVGFVGYTENSEVRDLTFNKATLYSTNGYVGPIGYADDGTLISNVHTKNSYIYGVNNVGGIAGGSVDHYDHLGKELMDDVSNGERVRRMPVTTIENCTVDTNTSLVCTGSHAGGIAGLAYGVVINNCSSKADISGNSNIGGIVGQLYAYRYNEYAYVINSSCTDAVITGKEAVGGIVGSSRVDGSQSVGHNTTYIVGCYTDATINYSGDTACLGSILGYNTASGMYTTIYGCYAISTLPVHGSKNGSINVAGTSRSFANAAEVTAEVKAELNAGIQAYNDFAAAYVFSGFNYSDIFKYTPADCIYNVSIPQCPLWE